MFVDVTHIQIKAGNGGNGAVSFLRDKFTVAGGPDGGNGGHGGSIVFKGDNNVSTLANFRHKKFFEAENGKNGASKNRAGKSGKDLIITVPLGTLVKNEDSGELLADISEFESQVLIIKGGRGGLGNANFRTSTRQSPKFAKPGEHGKKLNVILELKLLADAALIGFPNVGKSTILSIVSNAKPQIADYPFTTLAPVLGVVKYSDDFSFVIADIPGLIQGAWQGQGLGHNFLKHIERCRLLVHVLDVSEFEGRNAIEDFKIINNELKKFNSELTKLPMIVVGNKCDLANKSQIESLKNFMERNNYVFLAVSAKKSQGIQSLLDSVANKLSLLPKKEKFLPVQKQVFTHQHKNFGIIVNKVNDAYVVKSKMLERLLYSINFNDTYSRAYFQNVIKKSGLVDILKKLKIKNGDVVKINDLNFSFFE